MVHEGIYLERGREREREQERERERERERESQQLPARRRTAESCSAEIIRIAAPTSKDVLEVLTCALKTPCSKAKDMYKYFEDLALTMYKNSVWCGVVWLETFTQRKKLPTWF